MQTKKLADSVAVTGMIFFMAAVFVMAIGFVMMVGFVVAIGFVTVVRVITAFALILVFSALHGTLDFLECFFRRFRRHLGGALCGFDSALCGFDSSFSGALCNLGSNFEGAFTSGDGRFRRHLRGFAGQTPQCNRQRHRHILDHTAARIQGGLP